LLSLQKKMAEFLTHEKDIYHTKVHLWIIRSQQGKETTSRTVHTVNFIISFYFILFQESIEFFWKRSMLLVKKHYNSGIYFFQKPFTRIIYHE
jgi:hypothetical protein